MEGHQAAAQRLRLLAQSYAELLVGQELLARTVEHARNRVHVEEGDDRPKAQIEREIVME